MGRHSADRLRGLVAVIWVGLVSLSIAASAEAQQRKGSQPCRGEFQKLCPDLKPGSPEFRSCVQEKTDQLSPECSKVVNQARERVEKMRASCDADIEKFCSDVKQGGGSVARCLRQHRKDLTAECREGLMSGRRGHGAPGRAPAKSAKKAGDQPADEGTAEPAD